MAGRGLLDIPVDDLLPGSHSLSPPPTSIYYARTDVCAKDPSQRPEAHLFFFFFQCAQGVYVYVCAHTCMCVDVEFRGLRSASIALHLIF